MPTLQAPRDERRVAVAEAISYTGIDVLPNDKRALSLQDMPSLMTYLELIMAECMKCLTSRSSRRSPQDFAADPATASAAAARRAAAASGVWGSGSGSWGQWGQIVA